MPIGNGDVGANVWVEEGGDLRFYIGKTDSYRSFNGLLDRESEDGGFADPVYVEPDYVLSFLNWLN